MFGGLRHRNTKAKGRTFFLTSLLIELIEHARGEWRSLRACDGLPIAKLQQFIAGLNRFLKISVALTNRCLRRTLE